MQEAEGLLKDKQRMSRAEFGSDLIIELFAALGIPYVVLNPGSSFRGIHDSLVNFAAPDVPKMVVCLHEEIAVAVAHGWARVTGRPLVAATHDVVGLYHASMAVFNAWCDRIPIILIGGTGPAAPENRRAHIDWVHTANVQGNVVRDIVKWDDQPASLKSIPESILRGYRIAMTEPAGPVYLCFDADLQEMRAAQSAPLPDASRYAPPAAPAPDLDALERAADMLAGAEFPVILADAVGRHREAIAPLAELGELLAAPIVSTASRFNLASNHPLNLTSMRREVLNKADVLLALDVFDLASATGPGISAERDETQFLSPDARVIHIGLWDLLQHSLVSDYERLMPVDLAISADTRVALPLLAQHCRQLLEQDRSSRGRIEDRRNSLDRLQGVGRERRALASRQGWESQPIAMERVFGELAQVVKEAGVRWCFVNGGERSAWEFTDPDELVGGTRGAGLGQAAGAAVGASLALKDSDRLCISVIGDGDFLYTPSALWTAANQRLPLLTIVNDNRSYGNDEGHQEYIARMRGRPVENKGVGIFIENPTPDFAELARAFDVEGFGPVEDPADLLTF